VLVFVAKRLVWTVLLLAVITLIAFVVFLAVPNTAASRQGLVAPNLQTQWHIGGHTLPYQYAHFLDRVLWHGDFGHSLRQPITVRALLLKTLPVTVSLVIGGTIMWLLIAFPIGLLSALRPRSLLDKGLMAFVLVGVSAHPLWLGLILSYFLGFKLHVFPLGGYCHLHYRASSGGCGGPRYWAWHMVLPWFTFALVFAALYARMLRASVLEALDEDYVRTALAKGASKWRIMRKHVLRNAMLPIVTMLGMDIGLAFGGALFIETAYDLPGMGQTLYQALGATDLPVIMGVALVVSTAVALGNLAADLLYCVVDPRVRLRTSGQAELGAALSRRLRPQPRPARVTESVSP
jgi:peptide/nickel transport system permease protein